MNYNKILDALDSHKRKVNTPNTHTYLNIKKEVIECFIQTESEDYYLVTNENGCDVWLIKNKVTLKE
jgi:predicted DNA-binding protein